jgi:hypothetical protein
MYAPPLYNVDENRDRFRLRARLGMDADLFDAFTASVRIATGDSRSPVSTNQTLGGSGGNFSKYEVWLDRANIKYQPVDGLAISVGRFDNPFFATDLIWDGDLGFDGAAVKLKHDLFSEDFAGFMTLGAFPIYNTSFNYPTTAGSKSYNEDRWLFGAQAGVDTRLTSETTFKLGSAFYLFDGVQGRESQCYVTDSNTVCPTDNTRPSFAQRGNTYRDLRNFIILDPVTDLTRLYQYYGLASDFQELSVTGRLDIGYFSPFHIILDAEYVKNVAFDKKEMERVAINNRGPDPDGNGALLGKFEGGDMGLMLRATIGQPELKQFGDWNLSLAYKYLESDAMVDAFTDSDLGLGGTNVQGYIVGGKFALGKNVWTEAKWMSADEIAGPPLSVDVVTLDLNAKF